MADDKDDGSPAAGTALIPFHYIKSNHFRVVRADGAHGGVNPRLQVQMALYNERIPIPQKVIHRVLPNGTLDDAAVETIGRDGFVREVEVEVLMDWPVARSLAKWLTEKADEAERLATKGAG